MSFSPFYNRLEVYPTIFMVLDIAFDEFLWINPFRLGKSVFHICNMVQLYQQILSCHRKIFEGILDGCLFDAWNTLIVWNRSILSFSVSIQCVESSFYGRSRLCQCMFAHTDSLDIALMLLFQLFTGWLKSIIVGFRQECSSFQIGVIWNNNLVHNQWEELCIHFSFTDGHDLVSNLRNEQ